MTAKANRIFPEYHGYPMSINDTGDQRPAPQAVQLRLAYFRVPGQIHSPCQTEQRKTAPSQQAHHFIVSGQQ